MIGTGESDSVSDERTMTSSGKDVKGKAPAFDLSSKRFGERVTDILPRPCDGLPSCLEASVKDRWGLREPPLDGVKTTGLNVEVREGV